jgi:hypothetical protein
MELTIALAPYAWKVNLSGRKSDVGIFPQRI